MLLLVGVLTSAFSTQPVEASFETIYIRADGNVYPSTAPIRRDGNSYTLTGDILSSAHGIVIQRNNMMLDGSGYTLQGPLWANGIDLSERSNVTIKNVNVKAWIYGIKLGSASNVIICGNNITATDEAGDALWLWASSNNIISGNQIKNSKCHGISLYSSSSNNSISGNQISENSGIGIGLDRSSNYNNISENNIANNYYGISLYECSNNIISGNQIEKAENGIFLALSSNYNSISGNQILNSRYGIWLARSSIHNVIYHNNIINNTIQVFLWPFMTDSPNVWDDGYPSGGNYWGDYTGVDEKSGPNQDLPGSDGIGDLPYPIPVHPYNINSNNIDHYPLPPRVKATLDIDPDRLNLKSKGKWITAYIEFPKSHNVKDINVSTIMLNGTIPVELRPVSIGDYDKDKTPDMMVKLDRARVISYLLEIISKRAKLIQVTLTITGKFRNGTRFEGSDTIKTC